MQYPQFVGGKQSPLKAWPQIAPETEHVGDEEIVIVAFTVQLPDEFGPYEMPPLSVSVMGNTGA